MSHRSVRSATSGRNWKISFAGSRLVTQQHQRLRGDVGQLMSIPSTVPLNWLGRSKIRIAPIEDGVVADEQTTIDLYFRSGLIKHKFDAADIVDRSFSEAIGKGADL
jgi:hypothetical protein